MTDFNAIGTNVEDKHGTSQYARKKRRVKKTLRMHKKHKNHHEGFLREIILTLN
jgi:hypothetical protein